MIITLLILIGSVWLGGLALQVFGYNPQTMRIPLVFAGAFLFSITLIHILPELYTQAEDPFTLGLLVLAGFFFQQILEFFSHGVEHGHFHSQASGTSSKIQLLIALVIHSILEGSLLSHSSPFHEENESYSLLIGIVLHKTPAAFALMSVFRTSEKLSKVQLIALIIFSLASPIGLLFSGFMQNLALPIVLGLFAFVSGSFLHISTTIFVESSPDHRFRLGRILTALIAAVVAVISEMII